ncbi:hypothetical protein PI125_g9054 [Phytophthora idaei]|nr:hypothetical protein PI125_g9054 [Phytophthora idaei]
MRSSHACAERARKKEQVRQAMYYNRRVKETKTFVRGDRVRMFRPPEEPKTTKLVHMWIGPLRIVEPVGYENYLVRREDQNEEPEEFIAHVSFLTTYHTRTDLLKKTAAGLNAQLEYESQSDDGETTGATARPTTAQVQATTGAAGKRPRQQPVDREDEWRGSAEKLLEVRRRWRCNRAGQCVLEFELRPVGRARRSEQDDDGAQWVSITEYDEYFQAGRVVEDSTNEEGV